MSAPPARKPHTSTADLLTWSETPPTDSPSGAGGSSSRPVKNLQPSDGIRKVVFGGQVTDEEVENLLKRKPCSGHKLKEMTGSGIFAAGGEANDEESEATGATPSNKTRLRMYQQAVAGISQISFGSEERLSPKKPTTLPEVAKQRELSGNLDSASDALLKKQLSDAKCKELSGHNIFAPPLEIVPRKLPALHAEVRGKDGTGAAPQNAAGGQSLVFGEEPVIQTAKKIPDQKFVHLSGNNIFKEDTPPKSTEKPLSVVKLREISGSNIFADGKAESRDYLGGVRKPPGGESSIALV